MNYDIYRVHIERPGDSFNFKFFTKENRAIQAARSWINSLDPLTKKETCIKVYKNTLFGIDTDERLVNELSFFFASVNFGIEKGEEVFRIEGGCK